MSARYLICPLLGLLALPLAADVAAAEKPNVIVILVDDLGYGDLSSYGATDLKSPNIDSLISRGMKFVNFYANCPVCSPTRAALLTGRYQDRVGVPGVIRTHPENNWGYFDTRATTLPDHFRDAGYTTAIVGKWHLGLESPNTPNERGFDHFHGYLGDMMDDYYNHRRHGNNYMRKNGEEIDPKGHATELFTTWACDFIEAQTETKPFLLYLAYNAPHTPIQPPEEWFSKVREREPGISEKRAKLVALIEHLDQGVGEVMKTLDESGQAANTIVVFTSDNGGDIGPGASNGPLRAGKGTMYEGGLKVPAAVMWPGKIEAGSTSEFAAMTMDLFPTLLDVAGASVETSKIEGRSFLPTLLGHEQAPLREEWYFVRREGGAFAGKTIEALRKGDWKLVWNDPFGAAELFNLEDDPLEQNDLIKKHPKIANELRASMMRHLQAGGEVPWQGRSLERGN